MQRLFIFALIIIPFLLNAQVYESRWQSKPIMIDGKLSEWDERPGHFDAESSVLYGYRNDSSNLYLAFELSNKMMQMKAMNAGFSIDIKVKSQTKVNANISFPVQAKNPASMNKGSKPNMHEMQTNYKLINAPAIINGFILNNGTLNPGEVIENKMAYEIDWDEHDAMIFEIRIPFSELFEKNESLENIQKAVFSFSSTFAALQRPDNNQMQGKGMSMNAGGGGGGGRGMGGGPGGGGGGGGQRPGGDTQSQQGDPHADMTLITSEQKLKSKFKLIFK